MRFRYPVKFLDRANSDLAEARRWLLQPGSGVRSHRRYAEIIHAVQDLKSSPGRWPSVDHNGIRERSVAGYRLVYRVDENLNLVVVLRVFGPFQNRPDA